MLRRCFLHRVWRSLTHPMAFPVLSPGKSSPEWMWWPHYIFLFLSVVQGFQNSKRNLKLNMECGDLLPVRNVFLFRNNDSAIVWRYLVSVHVDVRYPFFLIRMKRCPRKTAFFWYWISWHFEWVAILKPDLAGLVLRRKVSEAVQCVGERSCSSDETKQLPKRLSCVLLRITGPFCSQAKTARKRAGKKAQVM